MKFVHFAVIVVGSGFDSKVHRAVIKSKDVTYTTVCINAQHKEEVVQVAKQLVHEGAQIVELCGGFGPVWMAKVMEALKGKVPVGGVFYGPEARQQLVDLGLTHRT